MTTDAAKRTAWRATAVVVLCEKQVAQPVARPA
jgi:hypothetical protein